MPKTSYGSISTLNQDQRQGPHHPHKNVSRFLRRDGVLQLKCFDCGAYVEDADLPETCDGPSKG